MPLVAVGWQGDHQHLMTENSQVGGGPVLRLAVLGHWRVRDQRGRASHPSGLPDRRTTAIVIATATSIARQSMSIPTGP